MTLSRGWLATSSHLDTIPCTWAVPTTATTALTI